MIRKFISIALLTTSIVSALCFIAYGLLDVTLDIDFPISTTENKDLPLVLSGILFVLYLIIFGFGHLIFGYVHGLSAPILWIFSSELPLYPIVPLFKWMTGWLWLGFILGIFSWVALLYALLFPKKPSEKESPETTEFRPAGWYEEDPNQDDGRNDRWQGRGLF
jgi:hypothetical protein